MGYARQMTAAADLRLASGLESGASGVVMLGTSLAVCHAGGGTMTDHEATPRADDKTADQDPDTEERVRVSTHWGTPSEPETVQETRESSGPS